jgi:predicted PurR-regulated permease PerM
MNTNTSYIEKEVERLGDQERQMAAFSITVSTNIEKLTQNQQGLSKRLDDLNEALTTSLSKTDKRIEKLEEAEIRRSERKKTFHSILKLWPIILSAAFLFFILGHLLSDTEILKRIVSKWL